MVLHHGLTIAVTSKPGFFLPTIKPAPSSSPPRIQKKLPVWKSCLQFSGPTVSNMLSEIWACNPSKPLLRVCRVRPPFSGARLRTEQTMLLLFREGKLEAAAAVAATRTAGNLQTAHRACGPQEACALSTECVFGLNAARTLDWKDHVLACQLLTVRPARPRRPRRSNAASSAAAAAAAHGAGVARAPGGVRTCAALWRCSLRYDQVVQRSPPQTPTPTHWQQVPVFRASCG